MPNLLHFQLCNITDELKICLTGGLIQRIYQPDDLLLVLHIYAGSKNHRLLLSLEPSAVRCHLTWEKISNPPSPPAFCQLLRKHLENSRLTAVQLSSKDRTIEFSAQKGPGEFVTIIAELWSGQGNIHLLGPSRRILGSLRKLKRQNCDPPDNGPYPKIDCGAAIELAKKEDFLTKHYHSKSNGWNKAADFFYGYYQKHAKHEQVYSQTCSRLKKEQKKLKIRIKKLEQALEEANGREQLRVWGELLKSQLHQIKRGVCQINVINYFDNATPTIIIPLNPELSPRQNLETFFKRYRKLNAAFPIIKSDIQKNRDRYTEITALLENLQRLGAENFSIEDLPAQWQPISKQSQLQQQLKNKRREYRSFTSQEGYEILVGRGAKDNDVLTFRIAHGNDLWLHTEDYPGSHVVVRNPGRKEIPQETLLDAAHLASYFSKARTHSKISIIYTRRKYLNRPKKGRPGEVLVSSKKNLLLTPDQERIRQLLHSSR